MADGGCAQKNFSAMSWQEWVRLKEMPERVAGPTLRVVDAFSGCGGMSLGAWEGARRAGREVEIRLALDTNADALRVLADNLALNSDAVIRGDIRSNVPGAPGAPVTRELARLVKRVGAVDLFMAGPPCQGHSNLNNHSRRSDPRNELYLSAIRAVSVLRPLVAIIENVPPVVHDRARHVQSAANILEEMGYEVLQRVVKMTDFGIAQSRKRHITLASRIHSHATLRDSLEGNHFQPLSISTFLDDIVDECELAISPFYSAARASVQNRTRMEWLFEHDQYDLPDRLRPPCHRDKKHSYRSMYGRLNWSLPAQTITSGFGSMGQGRFVHPLRPRTLTCHEAARLQGFPDFFSFDSCSSLTALRDMIGNAVPPQFCATVVGRLFGSG